MIKLLLVLAILLVLFSAYVATREGRFHYEVSEEISAPVEKVFPHLSDLELGKAWNPFDKEDPSITYEFKNNKLYFVGKQSSGNLEIIQVVPNSRVEIRLTMTKPIAADNLVVYSVVPTQAGTRMTWSMSGDGGYFSKLMTVFMDCEKMMTDQFKKGIANLKSIVE